MEIFDPSILNPSDIESITVLKDAQLQFTELRCKYVYIKPKLVKRNSKTVFFL
jgi:hypothetical protein